MRIAILGGGGFRVPLLARALASEPAEVAELALYDPDAARMAHVAAVARAFAPGLPIRETTVAADAVRGSRFVIASIRVGGQRARAHDERVCGDAGILGQETVGAGGAALALRNVPAMLRLARIVDREAPDATLVNYTNPVGMVTDALIAETGVETVGICDTPAETAERAARLLYLDPEACVPGWSGINHLGWLTALYEPSDDPGDPFPPVDRLRDLYRDPERLERVHRPGLFPLEAFAGAVPSEYVFYHRYPERAARRARQAAKTRGAAILEFEERLFAAPGRGDPAEAYQRALAEREGSYFAIETGASKRDGPTRFQAPVASGYDRIGLAVVRARSGGSGAGEVLVVNTRNRTPVGGPAVPELPTGDVVEVASRVDGDGVRPIAQPPLPPADAALLRRVRAAEKEIARAAVVTDVARASEALREHPAGGRRAAAILPRLRVPREPSGRSRG